MFDNVVRIPSGLTIRKLKEILADCPEVNSYTGEEYEVYIDTGYGQSSIAVEVWPLNKRKEGCDILLN